MPDGVINHDNPTGFVPTASLKDYGSFALLGGREVDEFGRVPLKKISGVIPANIGSLALGGTALASAGLSTVGATSAAATVAGAGGLEALDNSVQVNLHLRAGLVSIQILRSL